jgi:hypothetical protein
MAEIATESKQAAKPAETSATQKLVNPMRLARRVRVVDRASDLSDEVLKSLEAGERAAIDALGQFVITFEEALPQEVAGTSEVAKKVTESGLQMADRLVHTQYDVLRDVIASAAKSLSSGDGAGPKAAR